MERPLIGIPTFGKNGEGHFSLPAGFVACVRRAGGLPVLMPPGEPHLDAWFEGLDGLMIASGVDVDPGMYGGEAHPTIGPVDRERDQDEIDLVHQAIEAEVPLLAICRGLQVLNVALGGSLIADVPTQVDQALAHRVPVPPTPYTVGEAFGPTPHEIVVDPGSRLAAVVQEHRFAVQSWHHQAVETLGDGLAAVAHAADGVVEALEMPEHPWLVAVQWHPEIDAAERPVQQRLFDGFVAAAGGL